MRLLVVEDEKDLNHIIVRTLEMEGYDVDFCYDGADAVYYISSVEYDAVILDVMIPEINGFEVLREIRNMGIYVPILFLTARDNTEDIVQGLDEGANDYMIKPFSFDELLARIRVLTRTKPEMHGNIYQFTDLEMDCDSRTVKRQGKEIILSPKEYSILEYLMQNKNIVLTRDQIASKIWNLDFDAESNVIDVYISYLRKKIDDDYESKLIHTVRGVGYILKCET